MNGIDAKLVRANETLTVLEREAMDFERQIPPPRIEKGFKPGTSIYAFRAYRELDVPLRFAVLAGEVIHHLRSSLDHLVAGLVQLAGHAVSRAHQFPICKTPEQFQRSLKTGCLDGVPAAVTRVIEGYQPYLHVNPNVAELSGLQELNNADKHRLLVVVGAAAQIGQQVRLNCGQDVTVTGMSPPHPNLMDGSEFFSVDFAEPYATANVDIDVKTLLALRKPSDLDWPFPCAPLIPVLQQCRSVVHHVIAHCLTAAAP
jgi:hypothetical protein